MKTAESLARSIRKITIIKEAAAAEFEVTVAEIIGPGRPSSIIYARHAAMWLCRELTTATFKSIALEFNRDNHATVLYACKEIEDRMALDVKEEKRLFRIRDALRVRLEAQPKELQCPTTR